MEFLSAEEARKINYSITLDKVREVLKDIEKHIKLKSENNKRSLYYLTTPLEVDFIKSFLKNKGYRVLTYFNSVDNRITFEIFW